MPDVQDLVSALYKLTRGVQAQSPAAERPPPGKDFQVSRAAPAARVRVRRPELEEEEGPYAHGGVEPPLEEVLRDPIVRALMRRDGVRPGEVRRRP